MEYKNDKYHIIYCNFMQKFQDFKGIASENKNDNYYYFSLQNLSLKTILVSEANENISAVSLMQKVLTLSDNR